VTNYLSYAGRGANAGWRYVVGSVLALVMTLVLVVAIVVPLQLAHRWPSDLAARLQDTGRPVGFFLLNGAVFALVLAGFVLAIRWVHRKTVKDVVGRWTWRAFGVGFGLWCVALVVTALIDLAVAPAGFSVTANRQTPQLALAAFIGLAAQTFTEEFVFRGYLTQGLLLATRRAAPAAVVSGLLFGALHIPNGLPQAANAVVFGVVLALIAIRTGGIALTFGLHLANNLFAAVVLVSKGDAFHGAPGVFAQNTPQLMWWDAGVGALALVVVAVAVARSRRLEALLGLG
jgi:membrane protease YdiL (CAAX protease family)